MNEILRKLIHLSNDNNKPIMILFDDIDMLVGRSNSFHHPTQFSIISIIIHIIDTLHSLNNNHSFICTSTLPLDQLHERLHSITRLNEVILLNPPDTEERRSYFCQLITSCSISVMMDCHSVIELKYNHVMALPADNAFIYKNKPICVCNDINYCNIVAQYILDLLTKKTEVIYLKVPDYVQN